MKSSDLKAMPNQNERWKWFLLGGLLAGVHTALFAVVAVLVAASSDPEAGMAYYIFFALDYPVSRLYQLPILASPLSLIPILGGFLWFLYGFVVQSLFFIRRPFGFWRLAVGVFLLSSVCLLPELFLKSLSGWEEHWHRGTAAREANDLPKAIRHVSEAVRVSPKENPILDGMWDYLGRLYMEQNDYDRAGPAFTNALAAATEKPNSRPVDVLNAYNQLAWFYERTNDKQQRKECLRKAIELNRIVYKGDSTQEAGCWHRLAEIAHDEGDAAQAQALIERAIKLESSLPRQHTWSLNYMKDQLKGWTNR